MGKQKTLSDLDNLFKLSKYYDMDIIGLLIEKEKSNPKEMDNLINSKKRWRGCNFEQKFLFNNV